MMEGEEDYGLTSAVLPNNTIDENYDCMSELG